VWGCLAFYKVPDPKITKLGPRVIKSVFVGYAENFKAYRLLDLSSNVIVESRYVEIIENKFNYDSKYVSEPNQTQVSDSYSSTSLNNDKRLATYLPIEQRKSQRVRKEKNFGLDFISFQAIVFLVEGNIDIVLNKIPIVLNTEDDPKFFIEAMSYRDATFLKEAVNDEWTQYYHIILGY
jgi:hypothetical protein